MKCRVPGVCALVVALLLCKAIAEGFHPTTHKCKSNQTHLGPYKMETPKTRTSSYSHHMTHHSLIEHGWSLECQGKPHPELRPFIRSITTTTGHHHVTSLEDHGITSNNHTFHTYSLYYTLTRQTQGFTILYKILQLHIQHRNIL